MKEERKSVRELDIKGVIATLKEFEGYYIKYSEGEEHFNFEEDIVSIEVNDDDNTKHVVCLYKEDNKKYCFVIYYNTLIRNFAIKNIYKDSEDILVRKVIMC